MAKNKVTLLNIIANLAMQIANTASWFLIPKIILDHFGSDANGLVSSLTQFLSYISLFEGGINAVVIAELYRPLIDHDMDKVSSIIMTSKRFYRRIGLFYIIYALILGIIYPIAFPSVFSWPYVLSMTVILSMGLAIQYMYSVSYKLLLTADKRGYVASFTQATIMLFSIVVSMVVVKVYPDLHILKLLSGLLFIVQPIVYGRFVKKRYTIVKNANSDKKLLAQRWNGLAINVAGFIHSSTDVVLLTIFTDLQTVSVYSVYSIVMAGLKSVVNAVSSAITPTIGKAYASGDKNKLRRMFALYDYVIFATVFILYSVAYVLVTPFVCLYTSSIGNDIYYQPIFGYIIVVAEAIYTVKYAHLNLAYSANKFKELTPSAYAESGINLVTSLLLIKPFGMIGVAIGTLFGMLYRMSSQVHFTTRLIDKQVEKQFYKKLIVFALAAILVVLICVNFGLHGTDTALGWIVSALVCTIIASAACVVVSAVFFRRELMGLIKYIKK